MNQTQDLLGSALLAVLLVACGAPSSAPSPGEVTTSGLVQSAYADCNKGGENLAHYLSTGEPKSNDPSYGNERQQVLSLQGEQRELAIRQYADQYIQKCAQQEAKAEEDAAAAKLKQTQQDSCAAVGGRVSWAGGSAAYACFDYRETCKYFTVGVGFNVDGTLDQGSLARARAKAPGCFH